MLAILSGNKFQSFIVLLRIHILTVLVWMVLKYLLLRCRVRLKIGGRFLMDKDLSRYSSGSVTYKYLGPSDCVASHRSTVETSVWLYICDSLNSFHTIIAACLEIFP